MCLQSTTEEYADDIDEDLATHEDIADAVQKKTPAQAVQPETQLQHSTGATQEIMRTKNFFLKPMSAEAAVEQCDQLGHDFYIFRESSSDQVQVVYKRRSVGYGVIVPVNDEVD